MNTEQLTLFRWEDPSFDPDKELEKQRTTKKLEQEAREAERKNNEIPWKDVNDFEKSNKYCGYMCIEVASWKVDGRECLDEHTHMEYQYESFHGGMSDGSMDGGGGYSCLRTLDRDIQNFFRSCDNYNIPGRVFLSKAAEALVNRWIEEGNNYYIRKEEISTLDELLKKIRQDYSPHEEAWDRLEWHAIKELGFEKGIELLITEYRAWRRRVMEHNLEEISGWQGMWNKHGPMDHYIERVEHAVDEYNFHAPRLNEPIIAAPPFLDKWKQELAELTERRKLEAEQREKELRDTKKKEREEKRAARKKEDVDKKASRMKELLKKYGTPFTDRMKTAEKAEDGRKIISEYTQAFHEIEVEAGLSPTLGKDGSGCAYRGFSTLSKTELKKAIKRVIEKDAMLGERLEALVEDIHQSHELWRKLYAKEIGELMEKVHCKDAKRNESMSVEIGNRA
jgi:hypothetical protein